MSEWRTLTNAEIKQRGYVNSSVIEQDLQERKKKGEIDNYRLTWNTQLKRVVEVREASISKHNFISYDGHPKASKAKCTKCGCVRDNNRNPRFTRGNEIFVKSPNCKSITL